MQHNIVNAQDNMIFSFHIFLPYLALFSDSASNKKKLLLKSCINICSTLLVSVEPEKPCMLIQCCLKIFFSFKQKRLNSLKDVELQSLEYFLCCPGSLTVSRDEMLLTFVAMQPLWHPMSSNVSVLYFMHKMGRRAVSLGGSISTFSLLFSQEKLSRTI